MWGRVLTYISRRIDKDWANISDRVLTHMSGRIVGKYYKNNLHPKTRSRREWRQLEM